MISDTDEVSEAVGAGQIPHLARRLDLVHPAAREQRHEDLLDDTSPVATGETGGDTRCRRSPLVTDLE
jgi:hypothetical protein